MEELMEFVGYEPEEIESELPRVEMTFRKLDYVGGLYNYWWKCRPLRFKQI